MAVVERFDTRSVSCVIPTFNRHRQLVAAIRSVMAQTHPVDEIIVVDDGSTDGTRDVLRQLQQERPEFPLVVLEQGNRGPAAARNSGMRLARGEYIAFLDDDDIWLPDKLRRQMDVFGGRPDIFLLGCATDTLYVPGRGPLVQIGIGQLLLRNWFLTPGVMVRRDALLACGGFPEDMRCCEDYAAWLRLVDRHPSAVLTDVLVHCGDGKPSFGASGLSRDLDVLYAGEREALRRWREAGRRGVFACVLTEVLAAARHWRRRLVTALRTS